MNTFSDKASYTLPDELARQYEIKSCLKYSEQEAAYLLCAKNTERLYLLKTASDPVYAELLTNENNILAFIHKSDASWITGTFPVPVSLSSDASYYIRTYIEGRTLEDLCESRLRRPGLPMMQALDYVIALTEQLHFLHTLNPPVIHRDIKPRNVIVDSEGMCHLIDMGISRFYLPSDPGDTIIMGTQLTAPPEQFGCQQTDMRSDLYSLGILLFYCITGEYIITDSNLSELSPPLQNIVHKATMFDPDQRYQSCRELMGELLAIRYPDFWR